MSTQLLIGVSEDAVSGHIQLLIPGETACFACAPPLVGTYLFTEDKSRKSYNGTSYMQLLLLHRKFYNQNCHIINHV